MIRTWNIYAEILNHKLISLEQYEAIQIFTYSTTFYLRLSKCSNPIPEISSDLQKSSVIPVRQDNRT